MLKLKAQLDIVKYSLLGTKISALGGVQGAYGPLVLSTNIFFSARGRLGVQNPLSKL